MYFTDANAERIDAARSRLEGWRGGGWWGMTPISCCSPGWWRARTAWRTPPGCTRRTSRAGSRMRSARWTSCSRRRCAARAAPPRISRTRPRWPARSGPSNCSTWTRPTTPGSTPGYYHVPEIIAHGWFDERPALAGKTGCRRVAPRGANGAVPGGVSGALEELLAATQARHVLVSYNSEGHLSEKTLRRALTEASADGKVRRFTRSYRRYRADSDHARRTYRDDHLRELLYYARLR